MRDKIKISVIVGLLLLLGEGGCSEVGGGRLKLLGFLLDLIVSSTFVLVTVIKAFYIYFREPAQWKILVQQVSPH